MNITQQLGVEEKARDLVVNSLCALRLAPCVFQCTSGMILPPDGKTATSALGIFSET
jgi:hypothetical protein